MVDSSGPEYRPGVAHVGVPSPDIGAAAAQEWTGTAAVPPRRPRPPVRYRVRRLTRGGEWSTLGVLFVGVCWGTWAISERGGNLIVPAVTLVLVLLVAAGLFALSRLLGRVILERSMGRVRRTAWPSHLLSAVFLAVAGVQYLRQTQWIVDGITWLRGVS